MSTTAARLLWFARHEFRLAWRDWLAMATGGKRIRLLGWILGGLAIFALMTLIAAFAVRPWAEAGARPDKQALLIVSGMGLLFWAITLSQALEAVTRVYYARSDLDLILSSPTPGTAIFAIRAGAVLATTFGLAALLVSPIVLSLAVQAGWQWLSAYLVLAAMAALSVAAAMAMTRLLFRLAGPRRTRLLAQIVAGIVGAGFVIGIQAAAILSHDGFSRLAFFQSANLLAAAPGEESPLWLPARAAMGDIGAALAILALAFALFALAIFLIAPSYARLAGAAAGLTHIRSRRRAPARAFAPASQRQVLRRKEWKLLQRDPWLLSQTLMQLLYLVPPALLLWINHGSDGAGFFIVVPVLVMASGQLAGGLAWLAISGEDAHDLVATAPLPPATILRAKVESVLALIGLVLAPILLLLALASWQMALITALFAAIASAAATAIQLWFRTIAKRSMFRRRQNASRAATLCEAFSSISWAGAAALVALNSPFALLAAIGALGVLGLARLISPRNT